MAKEDVRKKYVTPREFEVAMGMVDPEEERAAMRKEAEAKDPIVRAFRQLAYRHLARERYAEAEQLFRVLLKRRPEGADFMLGLGWTILRDQQRLTQERLLEARTHLRRACTRDPYNADTRYCMAMCYLACGYHRRVLDELQAALRSDPTHNLARNALEQLQGDNVRGRKGHGSSHLSRALRALSQAISKM